MTINNKFLLSTVCALSLASSMPVWADETEENENDGWVSVIDETQSAVLFKIHDVKPIRDKEGKVTNCEFSATFYNRSDNDVKNVNMELSWEDKAIEDVINIEKNVAKQKMENEYSEGMATGRKTDPESETEKVNTKVLKTSLKLPNLKPYHQVSLKSRIKSNRCFLLVNDVQFQLKTCDALGKNANSINLKGGSANAASSCSNLFKFVNANDPEYYREFKKVSFNEEKKAKISARKKEQEDLTKAYNQAVSSIARSVDIIKQIH